MMIHQQLMMDGESDFVVERGSQKMEIDQVPESELHLGPDDDLNATVTEVMTDVDMLLFVVNTAQQKRVQVSERKLTE